MEATKNPAFSLSRRIGSTNYTVRAHCSETEFKTFEEKIFHMIQNEELANAETCGIILKESITAGGRKNHSSAKLAVILSDCTEIATGDAASLRYGI